MCSKTLILIFIRIILPFSVRVKENAALIIARLYPQTIILFVKTSQIVDIQLHVMEVRPDVHVLITRETSHLAKEVLRYVV